MNVLSRWLARASHSAGDRDQLIEKFFSTTQLSSILLRMLLVIHVRIGLAEAWRLLEYLATQVTAIATLQLSLTLLVVFLRIWSGWLGHCLGWRYVGECQQMCLLHRRFIWFHLHLFQVL